MLIEQEEFDRRTGAPRGSQNETIFRYCSIVDLEIEGWGLDGALIDCTLRGLDWYWGLFNATLFSRTRFENCTFRGSSFMGCQIVDCQFIGCHFLLDNLGGVCRFENCSIVESAFEQCEFVLDSPAGRPVFTGTRWYGCTQTQCRGFAGLF